MDSSSVTSLITSGSLFPAVSVRGRLAGTLARSAGCSGAFGICATTAAGGSSAIRRGHSIHTISPTPATAIPARIRLSFALPVEIWLRTVSTLEPSRPATSSVDRPSISRRTIARRSRSGNCSSAACNKRLCCSSIARSSGSRPSDLASRSSSLTRPRR